MAVTALDLITDSLQKMGVYAPGEPISDADAERMLIILNDMLDSWSNETLSCYEETEQSVMLVVGQSAYTIGPGGDINGTRPLKIKDGPGAAYIQDTNGNNYGVAVVPRDQWNLIGNRSGQVNSNVPNTLFYDPQYPLGVLNFWPQPNAGGYTAFWDSYLQLTDFTTLTSTFGLPLGYKAALQSNLAIEAWPYFKDDKQPPPQLLLSLAAKHKSNIKRTNMRLNVAVYDPEIISHASGTYNVYTDRSGRNY